MKRKKRSGLLFWLVLLVWLVVFVLGGLLLSSYDLQSLPIELSEVFLTTAPPDPAGVSTPATSAENLKLTPTSTAPPPTPTQVPAEPTEFPELTGEPSATPVLVYSPTPALPITPIPFSEGPFPIGAAVSGRAIEAYRFGTGPVHRMIVAGIHGGYEWNTVRLADQLIDHLNENPDLIPRTVTLFIVQTLNPDGYAREWGIDGRVNNNGVDLNRNFPVNWAADWERQYCWNYAPTSSGESPGSEPETQALINFIQYETHVTALISYHSAALGIFPGGEPPHEPSVQLAEALADASTYPYPPIDIGCFYTGTLPDWAASVGIAAVDLELHNHAETDFEENLIILKTFLNWRR